MTQAELKIEKNTETTKSIAQKLGFSFCGISKSGFLEEEAPRLIDWLSNNQHGSMQYMENHFDKRLNPNLLVEGTKSVISLMYNYYPSETLDNSGYKISKYAYGEDYHTVIRERLQKFLEQLQLEIGASIEGRGFTDSAPILERAWAKKSGLGWIGKNANLINPKRGSFYFIANLLVNIPLKADTAIRDYCGTCTRCIDACPTQAIVSDKIIDSRKCISYLTIESKAAEIPRYYGDQFEDWMYGCDVCQDVCPWNKFSKPHSEPAFEASSELRTMRRADWDDLTQDLFSVLFRGSAIKRAKYSGLKRNIEVLKNRIDLE